MNNIVANKTTLLIAAALPMTAALWLLTGGIDADLATRVAIGLLAVGMAAVVFSTWTNVQPIRGTAQILRETDRPSEQQTPAEASRSRWQAWEARGDVHTHAGRARAALALSVVCTGSLLAYTWFR